MVTQQMDLTEQLGRNLLLPRSLGVKELKEHSIEMLYGLLLAAALQLIDQQAAPANLHSKLFPINSWYV